MRNISPYNFLAFANGALPAAIECYNNNDSLTIFSSATLLAPSAIFAEDSYFNNMMINYSGYNIVAGVVDISYAVYNDYNKDLLQSAAINIAKAVFVPLVALGVREMFSPEDNSKKIDIAVSEKPTNYKSYNDNLDISLSLDNKVETLKSEPVINNYITNTYCYPDYSPVDSYISYNPYSYDSLTMIYDYPEYTPYVTDIYNPYYDPYSYSSVTIYDYPDYTPYVYDTYDPYTYSTITTYDYY